MGRDPAIVRYGQPLVLWARMRYRLRRELSSLHRHALPVLVSVVIATVEILLRTLASLDDAQRRTLHVGRPSESGAVAPGNRDTQLAIAVPPRTVAATDLPHCRVRNHAQSRAALRPKRRPQSGQSAFKAGVHESGANLA